MKRILEHFGKENQIDKLLCEERKEYEKALIEYAISPGKEKFDSLLSELADLVVLTTQLGISEGYTEIEVRSVLLKIQYDKSIRTLAIIDEMKETGKSYEEIRSKFEE